MNARSNFIPEFTLDDDIEEFARVAAYAVVLRVEEADLNDEPDVWRALMRRGVMAGDAMKYAPDAIRRARENAHQGSI